MGRPDAREVVTPITLSIEGDGKVVHLNRWNIRDFLRQLNLHNSGAKQMAPRFSFPWLNDAGQSISAWDRLRSRVDISKAEIHRIEKQVNYALARGLFTLCRRPKEVTCTFVPSKGRFGMRRAKMLPFNGLALELRDITREQLLNSSKETVVVTSDDQFGSFQLLRFSGVKVVGMLSERSTACVFCSFYDRSIEHYFALSALRERRWYQVVEIGALDGFSIQLENSASDLRYAKQLSLERNRVENDSKLAIPRSHDSADKPIRANRGAIQDAKMASRVSGAQGKLYDQYSYLTMQLALWIETLSNMKIWELVSAKRSVYFFQKARSPFSLHDMPRDFVSWLKKIENGFLQEYNSIELQAWEHLENTPVGNERDLNLFMLRSPFPVVSRLMFADEPYERAIWELLRPNAVRHYPQK